MKFKPTKDQEILIEKCLDKWIKMRDYTVEEIRDSMNDYARVEFPGTHRCNLCSSYSDMQDFALQINENTQSYYMSVCTDYEMASNIFTKEDFKQFVCPISQVTGTNGCHESPYYKTKNAVTTIRRKINQIYRTDPDKTKKLLADYKKAMQVEIDFLANLLDGKIDIHEIALEVLEDLK